MKDELPKLTKHDQSLDARFSSRPRVYNRLHEIADMMDKAMAEGATADQAEAMAIEKIRQLGADVLSDWAHQKQSQSLERARRENPSAINHVQKK